MTLQESLAGKRVLIVDDMSTVRKSLVRMLSEYGVETLEAADSEAALALVFDQKVDAFLLDIMLPGMDGITLCKRLRGMERFRHTPVIFITGMEQDEVLQAGFDAGGDDMVSKPVSQMLLAIRLSNYINRAAGVRQLEYLRRSVNRYVCPRTQKIVEQYATSGYLPPPAEDDVCILFTDVRGFTQMSQQIAPETLFSVLSEHLGAQVRMVYRFNGYIDKFSGDGLMAVFDGPERLVNACQAALKIVEYAHEQAESAQTALHHLGVGVHAGRAMIGNIGSDKQLDYTALGPTVNLAARLCGHAEAMSVVVSGDVCEALADDTRFSFINERHLQVKGIDAPVLAYNLRLGERGAIPIPEQEVDALPR